jgi:cell division protein FtsZ
MLKNFEPDIPHMNSAIIKVIGVGGGGSNAVNHMYHEGIEGVQFYVCNTDAQDLLRSPVPNKIQLGLKLTEGLGAGSEPEMGRKAALESTEKITDILRHNTKMVFITAGMGGGTGTGAAPVIAKIAKELGILTIGIVTVPFKYEGPDRREQASQGIDALKPHVDALLTIINDRVLEMYEEMPFSKAYSMADNVLCTAAKGIAEIITLPGILNVDFKDVETAMRSSGRAILGMGSGKGNERAMEAVKMALDSPLLDNMRISGARHLLVNISYGKKEPLMRENGQISEYLQSQAGNNAKLKLGVTPDSKLDEELIVTVIATGFGEMEMAQESETAMPVFIDIDLDPILPDPVPAPVIVTPPFGGRHVNTPGNTGNGGGSPVTVGSDDINTPAYLRQGIQLIQIPDSEKEIVSRLNLSEDTSSPDGKSKLRGGNSFLHDNVD